MPRLTWGDPGSRFYEAGVDHGVLYVGTSQGVAWNGLVSITEETDGGESQPYYYDGIKYLNIAAPEEFKGTLEAFTYPQEFEVCDGTAQPLAGMFITHQKRAPFSLSYRTRIGTDLAGIDYAYKIHLIYNALAEPSTRVNSTIDENLDANNFSWNLTARPPKIDGFRRTSHYIFDSRFSAPEAMQTLEDILYGTNEEPARMPTVDEILEIYTNSAVFVVIDNGDGSFSVSGPDILVSLTDPTTFRLTGPTVLFVDDETYTVSSST